MVATEHPAVVRGIDALQRAIAALDHEENELRHELRHRIAAVRAKRRTLRRQLAVLTDTRLRRPRGRPRIPR